MGLESPSRRVLGSVITTLENAMSFVIHLHLGSATGASERSEPARADRSRSPGRWSHRRSPRRDHEEHSRRTIGMLAGGGRSDSDEPPQGEVITLADEDLRDVDDAAS